MTPDAFACVGQVQTDSNGSEGTVDRSALQDGQEVGRGGGGCGGCGCVGRTLAECVSRMCVLEMLPQPTASLDCVSGITAVMPKGGGQDEDESEPPLVPLCL